MTEKVAKILLKHCGNDKSVVTGKTWINERGFYGIFTEQEL